MQMEIGKKSKVNGKHNINRIAYIIMIIPTIHIPKYDSGQPIGQIPIDNKTITIPPTIAIIQQSIDGIIKQSIAIKPIIPKQNTT